MSYTYSVEYYDEDYATKMKFSFKTLLGAVPASARTHGEVTAAGVSVKKEDRGSLSTSDKVKLARSAREGSANKFSVF